ncbi:MAG: hypothetical protein JNL96_21870 [Planctomycetaceae bacterium]|nr:hypothetical protein [Planctomycetaceae bacterium]
MKCPALLLVAGCVLSTALIGCGYVGTEAENTAAEIRIAPVWNVGEEVDYLITRRIAVDEEYGQFEMESRGDVVIRVEQADDAGCRLRWRVGEFTFRLKQGGIELSKYERASKPGIDAMLMGLERLYSNHDIRVRLNRQGEVVEILDSDKLLSLVAARLLMAMPYQADVAGRPPFKEIVTEMLERNPLMLLSASCPEASTLFAYADGRYLPGRPEVRKGEIAVERGEGSPFLSFKCENRFELQSGTNVSTMAVIECETIVEHDSATMATDDPPELTGKNLQEFQEALGRLSCKSNYEVNLRHGWPSKYEQTKVVPTSSGRMKTDTTTVTRNSS